MQDWSTGTRVVTLKSYDIVEIMHTRERQSVGGKMRNPVERDPVNSLNVPGGRAM